ncbi:heparin lyase I family protein, partial [Bosea sp. CER48]|uniref:heparin lyase I family protein n=1 Tax=Bosea sp. CER48 TaxID=3377035 RepID=UPI0037FF0250
AEVWERPEVLAPYRSTVWYGLALHLDAPVPQDDRRYVIAQWKRQIRAGAEGDYSPFLALRLYRGRLGITVETDRIVSYPIGSRERPEGCRPGEALVFDRPKVRQTRALVAMEAGSARGNYPGYFNACAPGIQVLQHAGLPPARKGWIDFVVRSQPGPDGAGHIEVVADGIRIVTVRGHIGHSGPGLDGNQYFKFGPYRAPARQPWSVSYDDFRRGPRCSDVIRGGQCPDEWDDPSKPIGKQELSTSSDVR